MKRSLMAAVFFVVVLFGAAQAQTYVQLILDASGSMWNRLEGGEYRIQAAKDVLQSFVSSLPADDSLNVGLRVYGSRVRALDAGACEDSELFVPMAGVDREALLRTVRDAAAVGATPIAYSLEQAAQDFPAEGRKLIVLVTDGEESCGGDVRGVLEGLRAQGIDLELKIIGFDLTDEAARTFEGLGDFENARSAGELATALGRAVTVEQAATYPVTVTLTREGNPAEDGLSVTFTEAVSGDAYAFTAQGPGELGASLPAGLYTATVQDAFSDAPQTVAGLSVAPDAENAFTFELAPEAEVALTVSPTDPVTGSSVTISFDNAPPGQNWITVVPADAPDTLYLGYANVEGTQGEIAVQIPGEAVPLEARYHLVLPEGGSRVIGRSAPFTPLAAVATLSAPADVAAGTAFEVAWTGPNNPGDYVTVVPAGASESVYREYRYTRDGSPMRFTAPMEPGDYEIRYQSDGATGLIARTQLTVVASEIAITAPERVMAGAPFQVSWVGPDGQGDYLTIVPASAQAGAYADYAYTREGPTLTLIAGVEPGDYEVRYQSDREYGVVFARTSITVAAMEVTLVAPAEVAAGAEFEVSWTGPDAPNDYLTIVQVGASDHEYGNYRYTRDGPTVRLTAPDAPGQYEVRYQNSQGVFARRPITVR